MSTDNFPEMNFDMANLYKEEVITDQKIGTIRVMTPITINGETDSSREVQYIGQTQVMTPAGALPLNFELTGANLEEAMNGFGKGAKEAMERTMEEIKEMRRQQASQIVMPGDDSMGRSKIQMP